MLSSCYTDKDLFRLLQKSRFIPIFIDKTDMISIIKEKQFTYKTLVRLFQVAIIPYDAVELLLATSKRKFNNRIFDAYLQACVSNLHCYLGGDNAVDEKQVLKWMKSYLS